MVGGARVSAPADRPFIDPGQLTIPGLGPQAGERYRNRNTDTIVTVLGVRQGRFAWVTCRILGSEQEIRGDRFAAVFERI